MHLRWTCALVRWRLSLSPRSRSQRVLAWTGFSMEIWTMKSNVWWSIQVLHRCSLWCVKQTTTFWFCCAEHSAWTLLRGRESSQLWSFARRWKGGRLHLRISILFGYPNLVFIFFCASSHIDDPAKSVSRAQPLFKTPNTMLQCNERFSQMFLLPSLPSPRSLSLWMTQRWEGAVRCSWQLIGALATGFDMGSNASFEEGPAAIMGSVIF